MLCQIQCHQELHPVLLDAPVAGKVLPANVGTDRYLSNRTGSTGDAHQVNGGPTTPFLDVGQGVIGHGNYHLPTSDIYQPRKPIQGHAAVPKRGTGFALIIYLIFDALCRR